MRRIVLPAICAGIIAVLGVAGPVRGQTSGPPPPPPPFGGTPLPTIAPPCSPAGCPTATPTITPTPTVTPSPTATSTPVPLTVSLKLSHRTLKVGQKETIRITTLPAAHVVIKVVFPNKKFKHHGGHADATGAYAWAFKQPRNVTTSKSRTATVKVNVDDPSGQTASAHKKYTIK